MPMPPMTDVDPHQREPRSSGLAESVPADWGEDTIVAVSTATGAGAIGIVRMSGPTAVTIAESVFRPGGGSAIKPGETHRLLYGHVFDPRDGADVDEVLLAVMRAPHSYTREDIVEVHCHGGVAAQRAVLRLLMHLGARLAEPGEFTKRA
jgi:tRNA modification GTPase